MKKILLATACLLATAASASAQINVDIGLGGGPAYAEPVYDSRPHPVAWRNGRDRHNNYNWGYWHGNDHGHDDHRDPHHR